MDTGKARTKAKKSLLFEPLEGRQLLTTMPGQAYVKEISTSSGIQLRILASPNKPITVTINDNGTAQAGNLQVTVNGMTYTSQSIDTSIYIQGSNKADKITYNLTGDLISARQVYGVLNAGNDQFTANLTGNILTTKMLDLEVFGDSGSDNLQVNQSGKVTAGTVFPLLNGGNGSDTISYSYVGDINTDAIVGPVLQGASGNDTINLNYEGTLLGQFLYNNTVDGGAGNDKITANVHLSAASTGKVGTSQTLPALVQGGDNNDNIRFVVTVDPTTTTTTTTTSSTTSTSTTTNSTAQVFASAIGGAGIDTVLRSANVTGDSSNENDAVVS